MPNRLQILRARGQQRKTRPVSVPAPLKGWNTRDPFEAMDPQDAILIDNWYPDFAGLKVRSGSLTYTSLLAGGQFPVRTLAAFTTSSINRFLAATAGTVFDITNPVAPVVLASEFLSDEWKVATFNGHQFWVNGGDAAQIFDGTTLTATAFTGVTMSTMAGVGVFNNRLYFWTTNDPGFWYGPVDGIEGALSFFSFATVTAQGGNLIAVEVLSYDGGTGIEDYTCFFMSTGEVLLYSGTDPSNPNNWALVGRYMLAAPISRRSIFRYGGDIYLTTSNDHQQLSKLLIALKLGQVPALTKVTGAVSDAYAAGRSLPGWDAIYYPAGTRMIFNIPNPGGTFSQHVFNTSTQAWCRYQGWNAWCFAIFKGALYFGAANGTVIAGNVGSTDDGAAIVAQCQQAWQSFGSPLKKRIALVRPVVQANGTVSFNFGLGFDYQPATIVVPDSTISTQNSLVWGATTWGAPHVWGGAEVTDPRWRIAGGDGGAIGLSLSAMTLASVTWVRTDFMIEPGTAL